MEHILNKEMYSWRSSICSVDSLSSEPLHVTVEMLRRWARKRWSEDRKE